MKITNVLINGQEPARDQWSCEDNVMTIKRSVFSSVGEYKMITYVFYNEALGESTLIVPGDPEESAS